MGAEGPRVDQVCRRASRAIDRWRRPRNLARFRMAWRTSGGKSERGLLAIGSLFAIMFILTDRRAIDRDRTGNSPIAAAGGRGWPRDPM
jgi:hypothetical protein